MKILEFQGFALYQILTTLFCVVMVLKGVSRFRRGERSIKELIVWIAMWGFIGFFAFFPVIIDRVAEFFGVKSGAIGFLAMWIIFLTYAFFRTFLVIENIDKKLTELTRQITLDNIDKSKESK